MLIEDIEEYVCEQFDNGEPRSEHRMILALINKTRELIGEVNALKAKVNNGSES